MLSTTDAILFKLAGASMFTSLDAASGFWQIPLCENTSLLTAIIAPVGGHCFKRPAYPQKHSKEKLMN